MYTTQNKALNVSSNVKCNHYNTLLDILGHDALTAELKEVVMHGRQLGWNDCDRRDTDLDIKFTFGGTDIWVCRFPLRWCLHSIGGTVTTGLRYYTEMSDIKCAMTELQIDVFSANL